MKRISKILVLVFVMALIAAACGSSNSDETTTTAAGGTETTTTTAATSSTEATTTTAAGAEYAGLMVEAACDDETNKSEINYIKAVDANTVEIQLCTVDVAFPSKVAFSAFGIVPQEYLDATTGGGDLVDKPIGTGPYMLKQWDKGNQMVMERNPNHWGTPAIAGTLVFKWSSEAAQRFLELQARTVDGIDNPGRDDFALISDSSDLQLRERLGTNIFYLGLNRDKEPFGDEKVRQAIGMALDRQRIVDNFYPPGSVVADQFMPEPIFGYTPEPKWYDQDIEAAKALLAEAGYPDGFDVTLNYRDVVRSYLPSPSTVGVDIQSQLAQIGVNVTIEVMESGAFLDASDAGDLTMYMLGWGADYPDATNFLDFHFGKTASDQFGAGFEDIWALLDEGSSTPDPAARLVIYEQATQLIKDHVPMVPIAHGGSGVGYLADVTNAQASPLGNEYFAVMDPGGRDTFVWMQNAEPIGLYCADETDGESLRACEQITESLLAYEIDGTAVVPALAETYEPNADGTLWTFHLRQGVTFSDGSTFDANDVVASYDAQWDMNSPNHTGRDGNFTYWDALFGFKNNAG
ncbi:MAG TPA: ABC transporter substrate-binding protein [Acidimicrobiia bacterium]|nr:ABC transporter substrate-binding protein [Acidimicrobiia bacterium]